MFHFWLIVLISTIALHFMYGFGKLGQSKEVFYIAFPYTMLTILMHEYKLTFLAMMYVVVGMWCFYVVTVYSKRYERFEE